MSSGPTVHSPAVEPSSVLAAWAAGVSAGGALVTRWAVVGPGFTWLAAGVAVLLGVPAALSGAGAFAWIGIAAAGLAAVVATRRSWSVAAALGAAASFLVAGFGEGSPVLVVSAALALGGVTAEMLLGHWYLVDPRLPRSALRALGSLGLAGATLDPLIVLASGVGGNDAVLVVGWLLLGSVTVVLMAAVLAALRERGYPAVMAATGLSYLAVLTAIGAVVLGRVLAGGGWGAS